MAILVDVPGNITLNASEVDFQGNTVDISYNGTGTLDWFNINGSNAATSSAPGGGTVNIINSATLTLTGLENPTEVRVYDTASPLTELAGQETVTTGTFTAGIDPGATPNVNVAIVHGTDRQNIFISPLDMTSGDVTIPIQQVLDRQYANP